MLVGVRSEFMKAWSNGKAAQEIRCMKKGECRTGGMKRIMNERIGNGENGNRKLGMKKITSGMSGVA
jgi:hypothetical protein